MNLLKALIDTLICKGLWIIGKLNYPLFILPKGFYITRMNIDSLISGISSITIVRRSNKSKQETFNKFGMVRDDAILDNEIPGMSMNLLGGMFQSDFIYLNPTKDASKKWDGSEIVLYSKYRKLVQKIPVTTPIFFEVKKLHNITFPYNRIIDKDTRKLVNSLDIKPIEDSGHFKFLGRSVIIHEPTRLNYWHVEFQILDIMNQQVTNTSSNWKKTVAKIALSDIIKVNALMDCPNLEKIPETYYRK